MRPDTDLTCRISGRIPDTKNSRTSGQIEEIAISIHQISMLKNVKKNATYVSSTGIATGKETIQYIPISFFVYFIFY
jgi:hypothetical protein